MMADTKLQQVEGLLKDMADAGERVSAEDGARVRDAFGALFDQPDELIITLRKPVTLGATYHQLVMREPTAAEWTQWNKLTGVEANIKAVSVISGMPEPAVRQLGVRDLTKATDFLGGFFA